MKNRFILLIFFCCIAYTAFGTEKDQTKSNPKSFVNRINKFNDVSGEFNGRNKQKENFATDAAKALIKKFNNKEDEEAFWNLRSTEVKAENNPNELEHPIKEYRLLPAPIDRYSLRIDPNSAFGFSPDGKKFAISTPNKLEVYDAQMGKILGSQTFGRTNFAPDTFKGKHYLMLSINNREAIVVTSVHGKYVRGYNLSRCKYTVDKTYITAPLHVSYDSQSNTTTTVTTQGGIEVFNKKAKTTTTQQTQLKFPKTTDCDTTPQLSSDKKYLVTSKDRTLLICDLNNQIFDTNSAAIWNKKIKLSKKINTLAFSPNGKMLAVGAEDTVYVYKTKEFSYIQSSIEKKTFTINNEHVPNTMSNDKNFAGNKTSVIQTISFGLNNRLISVKNRFTDTDFYSCTTVRLFDLRTECEAPGSCKKIYFYPDMPVVFGNNDETLLCAHVDSDNFVTISQLQAPLSLTQYALVKALELDNQHKIDLAKDENIKKLFDSLPQSIKSHYLAKRKSLAKQLLIYGTAFVAVALATGIAVYVGYKATRFAYTQTLGRLINRIFKKQPIQVKNLLTAPRGSLVQNMF